ncbi:uncharacterized protein METZ01_LOCUS236465, partial [marine metagenome]
VTLNSAVAEVRFSPAGIYGSRTVIETSDRVQSALSFAVALRTYVPRMVKVGMVVV